jgi:hypothetical protein
MTETGEKKLRILLVSWLTLVALAYAVAAYSMVVSLSTNKHEAAARHLARIDSKNTEKGRTKVDSRAAEAVSESARTTVETGIYIDRIPRLSMRDTSWMVDFYIWFRWNDERVSPGESFHIVDGEIAAKHLESKFEEAGHHYELYHVEAEVTKFFDVSRFPRDDHLLTLRIEDTAHQVHTVTYTPDEDCSEISSRVKIPGYVIYETSLTEKKHSYKTRRGDPRLPPGYKATFSQLIFGIWIKRPGWALYIKMFLGTFASVAICLLAFFISPAHISPRFSVGVGAFFASVASTYVVSRLIPQSGLIGLTDFVTGVSLVTNLLTLLTSTISARLHADPENRILRQRFDTAALAVFLLGYVSLNVAVAAAASF